MVYKRLIGLIFAGGLTFSAAMAEVVVRVAPPVAVVETRGVAPGPGYVWIDGYHRWDGNAYAWNAGRWEMPPRPHARWVAHRWVHRHGGYVMVEGRWRQVRFTAALTCRQSALPACSFQIRNEREIQAAPVGGGSLDGAGDPAAGYSMRGGRMSTTGNYECTGQTVFAETVEFNEEHKSDAWPGWLTAAARKLP